MIEYADYECPFCAALHARLAALDGSLVFRHFPVRSSHPRAWAAACAAEAAGAQGRFWEMHDSLFADQARLEDPHLWRRAQALGLDLERFDADRRSEAVLERSSRDFHSGVRAGVVTTPTLFVLDDGRGGADRRLGARGAAWAAARTPLRRLRPRAPGRGGARGPRASGGGRAAGGVPGAADRGADEIELARADRRVDVLEGAAGLAHALDHHHHVDRAHVLADRAGRLGARTSASSTPIISACAARISSLASQVSSSASNSARSVC